jgi:hypothetical protein
VLVEGADVASVMAPFLDELTVPRYRRECICRRQRNVFVPDAQIGCVWCRGTGFHECDDSPIGKWDWFTVTRGEMALKPGGRRLRDRKEYKNLSSEQYVDEYKRISAELYANPNAITVGEWDQARVDDIDFDGKQPWVGHAELLLAGVWYEPDLRLGRWFPSRTTLTDRLVAIEPAIWAQRWNELVLTLPGQTVLSLCDFHS